VVIDTDAANESTKFVLAWALGVPEQGLVRPAPLRAAGEGMRQ
jgi:hypothetical protein